MERCGDKEKERDQRRKTPKGPTGTWAQAEGGKGGGEWTRDVAEESGTQCGDQRQSAEAGGWGVGKKSRWTMIHDRKECEEQVKERGEGTLKDTDWGAVRRGGTGRSIKRLRPVGRIDYSC